jgi:hypothetical protein
MPKADNPNTTTMRVTPGRRGLLGGAAALVAAYAATLPPSALAARTGPGDDPVLALWREYVDLMRRGNQVHCRAVALRAEVVARCGEPVGSKSSAAELWNHDPEYPELMRLHAESGRLCGLQAAVGEAIAAVPATSLAGLRIKVQLAMSLWPTGKLLEEADYHEDFAMAVLRDADRLLASRGEG